MGPKNAYRNAQKPEIVSGLKFLEIYDKDDDSLLDHIVIGWTMLIVIQIIHRMGATDSLNNPLKCCRPFSKVNDADSFGGIEKGYSW